ncbi:sortilin-related receptor-like isoform X2 [Dysidea avara]
MTKPCPYYGDFKCNDTGVCLRYYDRCDGYSECQNHHGSNSDYDEQNCASIPCPYDGDHRCGDNRCIRSRDVCNRYNNCRDGSDEINCECPYSGDVECNGRCYRNDDFCYHYQRCYGREVVNCSSISCPYDGDFRCHSDGACVRSYQVCDGTTQCRDRSDEENCTSLNCIYRYYKYCNGSRTCRYGRYACSQAQYCGYDDTTDNLCNDCGNSTLLSYWRINCDGIQDCADGSDEINCYERECFATDDFRCNTTGACIRNVQVCDGVMHCSDGSDEMDCLLKECSIPGDVKCKDNGTCIHSNMICDGVSDCLDGSDEANCSLKTCPYSDDRRCSTTQACIRSDRWCNNVVDCEDGTDEECFDTPCPHAGDFRCSINGYCIRSYEICDGYEHCLDGSDEGMNYCPEEVVMGVVWERSLTRITYKHKCSDIHPSFKLTDMVTRECMKNRSWAPVDVSQCVMDVDSPVVMILVMTLDTDSSTLVKSDMKNVIEEIKRQVINETEVYAEILDTIENVTVKITYEFNNVSTTELMESIDYDVNLTTVGNFNVWKGPLITIFESTDVCHCLAGLSTSSYSNNSIMTALVSICTGKPCECSTNNTCQCVAPFVGNGVVCGRDSDGDGYADMKLNCDDPECEQDICPMIPNPEQTLASCTINATNITSKPEVNEDEGLSTAAVIGITSLSTFLITTTIILLIVILVYKCRKSGSITSVNLKADSINDEYVFPENFSSSPNSNVIRNQNEPRVLLQPNPAYRINEYASINNDDITI